MKCVRNFNKQTKMLILLLAILILSIFAVNIMADSTSGGPSTSGSSKLSTSGGGQRYFGGRVTAMVPCTCSTGYQLTISGGLSTGTYLYSNARLYRNFNVAPSKWVLGGYGSGGQCKITIPDGCVDLPITKGTITFIATS